MSLSPAMAEGTAETQWEMGTQSPRRLSLQEPQRSDLSSEEGEIQPRNKGLDGQKDAHLSTFGSECRLELKACETAHGTVL